MRGTNNKVEDARNKSKEKMIPNMTKSTTVQAHHGTENQSDKKGAILA
jgi:hypothetical protein